ncbi:MAG: hypothetical protein R3Y18_03545, partial [Bacillota bacterium]
KPEFEEDKYAIRGEKANLDMQMLHISSGIADVALTDEFPDVNPEEYAGLEKQWHYTMTSGKAKNHVLVSCFYPSKAGTDYEFAAGKAEVGGELVFKFDNAGEEFEIEV